MTSPYYADRSAKGEMVLLDRTGLRPDGSPLTYPGSSSAPGSCVSQDGCGLLHSPLFVALQQINATLADLRTLLCTVERAGQELMAQSNAAFPGCTGQPSRCQQLEAENRQLQQELVAAQENVREETSARCYFQQCAATNKNDAVRLRLELHSSQKEHQMSHEMTRLLSTRLWDFSRGGDHPNNAQPSGGEL